MTVPRRQGPGEGWILRLSVAVSFCVQQVAHAHQAVTAGRRCVFLVEQDVRVLYIETGSLRTRVGPMVMLDLNIVNAHPWNVRTGCFVAIGLRHLDVSILFRRPPGLLQLCSSGFEFSECDARCR